MGAVSDYIQRYMVEHTENSWEQLKSELNVRSAEADDPPSCFYHYVRQGKSYMYVSVQVCTMRVYTLANDAFAKTGKAVVESQLVGFFH